MEDAINNRLEFLIANGVRYKDISDNFMVNPTRWQKINALKRECLVEDSPLTLMARVANIVARLELIDLRHPHMLMPAAQLRNQLVNLHMFGGGHFEQQYWKEAANFVRDL